MTIFQYSNTKVFFDVYQIVQTFTFTANVFTRKKQYLWTKNIHRID